MMYNPVISVHGRSGNSESDATGTTLQDLISKIKQTKQSKNVVIYYIITNKNVQIKTDFCFK